MVVSQWGKRVIDQWKGIGTEHVRPLGWQLVGEGMEMVPRSRRHHVTSSQIVACGRAIV